MSQLGGSKRSEKLMFFAACAAAVVATLLAAPAGAQGTLPVNGGRSMVTFDASFLSMASRAFVLISASETAQLNEGLAAFPIACGAMDSGSAVGQVFHAGALGFTRGTARVTFESLAFDTIGTDAVITAIVAVNGSIAGRIKLFDLKMPETLAPPSLSDKGIIYLPDVEITLDEEAATKLNGGLQLKGLFAPGGEVGTWQSMVLVPMWSTMVPLGQ